MSRYPIFGETMKLNRWAALGFLHDSCGRIVVLECRITGMQVRVAYDEFASGKWDVDALE